jgi:hypothetical protein
MVQDSFRIEINTHRCTDMKALWAFYEDRSSLVEFVFGDILHDDILIFRPPALTIKALLEIVALSVLFLGFPAYGHNIITHKRLPAPSSSRKYWGAVPLSLNVSLDDFAAKQGAFCFVI